MSTYRRVSRISVVPALAMVASVAILVGVAAIMAVVVAAACGAALLRASGAIRPATPFVTNALDFVFLPKKRVGVTKCGSALPGPQND
jgi:hypothetical protein